MSADIGERLLRWKSGPVLRDYPGYFLVPAHDIDEAAAEIVRLRGEVTEARGLVEEANNSLYGSQSYFHSFNGGPYNKHHLANGIEELKTRARAAYIAPAGAKGDALDGCELKSIANSIALLRERGTPLSRELALIELRIRSVAEASNSTPQPADGGAVAFEAWARPRFRGAEVFDRIEGRPDGWEYNGDMVQAAWAAWQARGAHPPAAQVQQQAGITPEWVIGYFPSDVAEETKRAVRDAFGEYAALATHPAGDALGAARERERFEEWATKAGTHHVSGYNPHEDLWRAWEAALQHRGDSQEVGRG